jgi:hypothetical protein
MNAVGRVQPRTSEAVMRKIVQVYSFQLPHSLRKSTKLLLRGLSVRVFFASGFNGLLVHLIDTFVHKPECASVNFTIIFDFIRS